MPKSLVFCVFERAKILRFDCEELNFSNWKQCKWHPHAGQKVKKPVRCITYICLISRAPRVSPNGCVKTYFTNLFIYLIFSASSLIAEFDSRHGFFSSLSDWVWSSTNLIINRCFPTLSDYEIFPKERRLGQESDHSHLMPRLWMRGALTSFPHTPIWCDV
jgi:hypothetical protein